MKVLGKEKKKHTSDHPGRTDATQGWELKALLSQPGWGLEEVFPKPSSE